MAKAKTGLFVFHAMTCGSHYLHRILDVPGRAALPRVAAFTDLADRQKSTQRIGVNRLRTPD